MIATNRLNRSQTQDGRALRRYKRRWTVERTIARLQSAISPLSIFEDTPQALPP
jgi:hypothetical protein